MSGHSKWHNIRLRKSKVDSQRGKLFTKAAKELIMAAREGGGDPEGNFRLRVAVEKAKSVNMPADTIKKAILKGTGELKTERYEEIIYEGYGPSGVAILINAATDNRNRTVADIRNILSRNGGSLGESGCVLWMFDKKALFIFDSGKYNEDDLFMIATEAGAEDITSEDGNIEVVCKPHDFQAIKEFFDKEKVVPEENKITMVPKNTITVGEIDAAKILKLIEALEDHDDIQEVNSNADIPDEVMEKLG